MNRAYAALLFLCMTACTSRSIVKGALTSDERREYVEQTGALIPFRLQKPFVEGIADTGMTREMVVFLYGQPDRTEVERYGITWMAQPDTTPPLADVRDSMWVYYGSDSISVKRGVVFHGDTVSRVTGDPTK
jgi:hypothetical protein